MTSRRPHQLLATLGLALLGLAIAYPATGQQTDGDEPPLPEDVVVDVDMIESRSFRIGIPDLVGAAPYTSEGGAVLRNDFKLMPGYRTIGPQAIRHDTDAEGLGVLTSAWGALSANAVIKGRVEENGGQLQVEMRLYYFARGGSGAANLQKTYSGAPDELRGWMHDFGNEVLRTVTGTPGPFGTHITWAERVAPGRKDVKCADMDGHGELTVSNGRGITMLPTFDTENNVWFTRLTQTGMFITRTGTQGRRIIAGDGLNMAPSVCHGRVFFVSSRDGNSEIYSSTLDGGDVQRLTRHSAIDVSPSCGPNGKIAFVSARHGSPQIWIMNSDGSGQRRVTYRGNHNQTPAFCPDPTRPLIAFTGRDQGLDIFTVNINTREYTRLTQGQGMNKDPAFSPDCRIVAFTSNRRRGEGIYLASPQGFNQHRVVEGPSETVRWQH